MMCFGPGQLDGPLLEFQLSSDRESRDDQTAGWIFNRQTPEWFELGVASLWDIPPVHHAAATTVEV